MSSKPTVSDDELMTLLELEHPLTSKEVGVITGLHPITAHNRLMFLFVEGRLDSVEGQTPELRVWWPHRSHSGHTDKEDADA